MLGAPVFAFLDSLGFQEMLILVVIGLLLYGRNLPQAGRTMGRFVAQLKRGFHDFKEQMDRDESLREVRKTIEDTTREVRNLTAVPRAIADPVQGLRNLTLEAVNSPVDDVADEPPPAPPAPGSPEKGSTGTAPVDAAKTEPAAPPPAAGGS